MTTHHSLLQPSSRAKLYFRRFIFCDQLFLVIWYCSPEGKISNLASWLKIFFFQDYLIFSDALLASTISIHFLVEICKINQQLTLNYSFTFISKPLVPFQLWPLAVSSLLYNTAYRCIITIYINWLCHYSIFISRFIGPVKELNLFQWKTTIKVISYKITIDIMWTWCDKSKNVTVPDIPNAVNFSSNVIVSPVVKVKDGISFDIVLECRRAQSKWETEICFE